MKKIKLNKGLKLNKESITKLQESQLSNFVGGYKERKTCMAQSCTIIISDNSCGIGSCNTPELM